ncbi:MAG: hypothetical protein ACRD4Z_00560 [Nitrososphaeraceae archaeon]
MKMRTVGTAWYLCLPRWADGKKIGRDTFYKYLKKLCDRIGLTRADIGLITGARADVYFKGEVDSVSYDSIVELAKKGTDVLFTEKAGLPDVEAEYADKWGIAIVNTRGKLTEYGKDLMEAITDSGGHVAIMADYDASGVKLASESPTEIPWIGANDEMLEYFKLSRESVAVASETKQNKEYVKYLVENACHPTGKDLVRSGEPDGRFTSVDIDFLWKERVELDALLAAVGEERFFEYIKYKFEQLYPERDYNRAIEVPTQDLGVKHEPVLTKINDKIKSITKSKVNEIKEELANVEGFLEVEEKLKDIKEELSNVFSDDPDYKDFTEKLTELVDSHPFFKEKSAGSKRVTPFFEPILLLYAVSFSIIR